MSISTLIDDPFYQGGGASAEVPGFYPVALAGRPYLVDLKERYTQGLFTRASVPILRNSQDVNNLPGESTLNPDDLWRRAVESWHLGTGQTHFDRVQTSDPNRFHTSKGVNPWTKWQLSLQTNTQQKRASANTNLYLAVAGSRLYLSDGTALVFTTDPTPASPTFTTVTGTPANAATSMATDGFNVWTSNGSNGVYNTTTSVTAATQWSTSAATLVRYVHGRLMAANAQFIYDASVSGTFPAALNSTTNLPASATWVDFAEGLGFIFAGVQVGDKSRIYKIGIQSDGSLLNAPSVAGQLPDGELVQSLQGYLGFLLVGTSFGVRFCTQDGAGNLTIGPLLRTGQKCQALEPQDRFCYFAWPNFDGNSTGLGRIDLSFFTAPMQPAYATDLMAGHPSDSATGVNGFWATVQGAIGAVVTWYDASGNAYEIFTVQGGGSNGGLFAPTPATLVPFGTVDSGLIMYGFPDLKLAMYFDVRHQALPAGATVAVSVNADEAGFNAIGSSSVTSATGATLPVGQLQATKYEFRVTLNRATAVGSGPTLIRGTLRSFPTPTRTDRFQLPLILHEDLNVEGFGQRHINPQVEFEFLAGLVHGHTIVTYQEQNRQFAVYVEDYEWRPHHPTRDGSFWNGLCILVIKTIVE